MKLPTREEVEKKFFKFSKFKISKAHLLKKFKTNY